MKSFSQRKFDLSPEKRALLEMLLQQKGVNASTPQIIPRRKDDSRIPLSFAQARLWFLDQLEPNSPTYNIFNAVRLTGSLNIAALEQGINAIIERHEALRTSFASIDGQPIQIIHQGQTCSLPVIDLSQFSSSEQEGEIHRLADEEAQQPFDLTKDLFLHTKLLRLGAGEHILFLSMHHIVSDVWSMGVLVQELITFYQAFIAQQPPALPPLPIQYADFAVWQREWLQGEVLASQLSYWKEKLGKNLPVLDLPIDRLRPPVQTFRGERQSLALPKILTAALKDLSQQEDATLFITLLAAFKTLLWRYTGQEDILVGSPIAGRNRRELEGLIGFFVNTLVLRTDISGNPRFRELLRRVREVALGAFAHQDLPFEKLVEQLQPERHLSQSPLFQVMFVLYNTPQQSLAMPGLTLSPLAVAGDTAKFDLTLLIAEQGEELIATLEYNTDLFDTATAVRILGHWQVLLEGIVANPEQQLATLPLLTSAEQQQLMVWNDTKTDDPKNGCIHQLFEQQVEQTPDAIAVVFEQIQLSYRQLNQRANQLAHYLKKLGVGPEVLVGIFVERSLEIVIGLLAILKAGGAYIPLDPAYPQERLAYMITDSQLPVLLTQEQLLTKLGQHQAKVVCLETDWSSISQQRSDNPNTQVLPTDNAYIIYTSGSTGQPKGVVIEHRNTVAFIDWASKVFAREHLTGVLASTSICFDLSVFEIFFTLSCGGKVILAENALSLPTLANAQEVTLINTVPSAIAELLRINGLPASIKIINLAGEALGKKLVEQLYEQTHVQQVFNLYGPSEDTTYSTWTVVKPEDAMVSIGRPIANTQVYILDSYRQPVPIGVPGEIYIGGAGLARGYFQRPELTAQRFIANPFSKELGSKLYQTGDLARYLPDGNIECLGRLDHQVKIRGFRIELGEIEALLTQHPGVKENVVVAREDVVGEKSLVAYVVPQPEQAPTPGELRLFLKEKLPEYMIPSAFVTLVSLPLTPNGKVDRKALPAPNLTRSDLEVNFVPARTAVEEILAGIWADVLRVERVGIHDNFFELGGHSLLAIQVISRLRDTCQVELPLRRLFENPTVARLATCIESAQGSLVLPLQAIARDQELPLSFAQQRLWFLDRLTPNSPAYNIPTAIRVTGALNVEALEASFREIIKRHEALRTTFTNANGRSLQIIHLATAWSLPVVDLRDLPLSERKATAEKLAEDEAQQPFDLTQGSLLRVQLLRLDTEEFIILLTMHHIIADGWSMDVLIREVASVYTAFATGQPVDLPELPIQYADFAYWQRQWLQGEMLATQMAYWQQQLSGNLPVLNLPTDRPRPAVQTFRGGRRSLVLNAELTAALKGLSQKEGVTLFMTLLAAFKTLLWQYTGQEDILVGSPIAGRNRSEIEGLIGVFINTLVLRSNLSDNPSFRSLLQQVKETALGAYAHQDLPFEKLVEQLQPERNLSHSPLFQVMFILQNTPQESLTLPDVTLSPLAVDADIAKFDLTLAIVEQQSELVAEIGYNKDLFDAATITRMLGHLQTILEIIVTAPDQKIENISLLTATETQQLLQDWNATQTSYPEDVCIHTIFEQQVAQTPEAIAVEFENQRLTYQELNQRANQLAHHLQQLGVKPDSLVGICVERSLEMVVGLLGILKAGGAYVPLDPAYPPERLSQMIGDSQLPVIITQQHLLTTLPEHTAQVVCLNTDWQTITQQSSHNPHQTATAENLAYIIYTSGSTGRPKGVEISHQAVVNFLLSMQQQPGLTKEDVLLAVTSICFDIAGLELYLPLIVGARIYLVSREVAADGKQLIDHLAKSQATFMQATPATWRMLLAAGWAGGSSQLKILCGGEALTRELANQLFGKCNSLWNMYGPTETTIWSAVYQVQLGDGAVPIGKPVANTQIYLLRGTQLQPVPVGVPGELYIGGAGLARGYFQRPELTNERFVSNPWSFASKLYKTGDLARYLPNGNIECLGRLDHQVKIRGFRIELGEIEAILSQHPGVKENVVVAQEDAPGEKRLVAYFVPKLAKVPTNSELRQFLKGKLPEYMLPSAFVQLEFLPLTPNGKVDRKALPVTQNTELGINFVAPRTVVEEVLAGIWADVLHLERVGVLDNFFDLGGHSLAAIQVMSRLNETLQIDLPLRHIFATPTVAELAQAIAFSSTNEVTTLDLQAEVTLDATIHPGNLTYQPLTKPATIFLTGATGFLGAFLLAELLQQTQADIYCLVRAANLSAGKQRLQENLEAYLLWDKSLNSRIIPVLGDLSQPLLGLGEEQFHLMARKIDWIYHNGALVNHVYPYALLKAVNVRGTEEVLRLASQIKIKPVHFISTTSVFASDEHFQMGVVKEDDPLEHSQGLAGGYAQSKWVAEKLVMMARDRGLPCSIYRFGRVAWHSQTGVWNSNDLFYRFIKGCIQLQSAPQMNKTLEITPVDYLTKALINLSQQPESLGKAFHLINPHSASWTQFIDYIRSLGYPLQQLAYDDWQAELLRSTQTSTENALYSFVALAGDSTSSEANAISNLEFDCQNALDGLVDTNIRWPEVDDQLLQALFANFTHQEENNGKAY